MKQGCSADVRPRVYPDSQGVSPRLDGGETPCCRHVKRRPCGSNKVVLVRVSFGAIGG